MRLLSEAQFRKGIGYQHRHLDKLNELAAGVGLTRNAGVILGALRTKAEFAYAKPAQEHELKGNVAITVSCAFPTREALEQAKVLPVANGEPQVLSLQQGPITYIRSTEKDENGDAFEPAVMAQDVIVNLMEQPSLIKAGRLVADPSTSMTAEQRRDKARADWLADTAVHAVTVTHDNGEPSPNGESVDGE
jgi:hypothetical protein